MPEIWKYVARNGGRRSDTPGVQDPLQGPGGGGFSSLHIPLRSPQTSLPGILYLALNRLEIVCLIALVFYFQFQQPQQPGRPHSVPCIQL